MASIEDRWYRTTREGERVQAARYGKPGRWRVRYTDPAGRARAKSFAKKVDAERFRDTTAADIARGRWVDPQAGRRTVAEYADEWAATRNWDVTTAATQGANVKHIKERLGQAQLGRLLPSHVQGFIAGLKLAESTKAGVLTTLRAILQAAVDDELIARNVAKSPSVHTPRPARRLVVPWSDAQIAALRAGLPERYQAMTDCGAGLGLRQGEIFGLSVDETDFLRRVVHVRQQVKLSAGKVYLGPPKRGKEREVPLPRQVAEALAQHIRNHPPREVTLPWGKPDGPPRTVALLFTTQTGRPLRRPDFAPAWNAAVRSAGMTPSRHAGCHQLRHTYASRLLASGKVDIKRLSVWLGHHSAAFTMTTYIHLVPTEEAVSLRAIEAALDGDAPAIAEESAES